MSGVQGVVYLVNKSTLDVVYAGEVPETYGSITGLVGVDYSALRDLHAYFSTDSSDTRYQNLGFLTEEDALTVGVPQTVLDAKLAAAWELKWTSLDATRNALIDAQRWRIDRYNDETALGIAHVEDITPVLDYIQAIRDLPSTNPDPYNIVWPAIPPLPGAVVTQ